ERVDLSAILPEHERPAAEMHRLAASRFELRQRRGALPSVQILILCAHGGCRPCGLSAGGRHRGTSGRVVRETPAFALHAHCAAPTRLVQQRGVVRAVAVIWPTPYDTHGLGSGTSGVRCPRGERVALQVIGLTAGEGAGHIGGTAPLPLSTAAPSANGR